MMGNLFSNQKEVYTGMVPTSWAAGRLFFGDSCESLAIRRALGGSWWGGKRGGKRERTAGAGYSQKTRFPMGPEPVGRLANGHSDRIAGGPVNHYANRDRAATGGVLGDLHVDLPEADKSGS